MFYYLGTWSLCPAKTQISRGIFTIHMKRPNRRSKRTSRTVIRLGRFTNDLRTKHLHDVRKPVFGVSDQVRYKPGCTATEDGQRLEISDLGSRGIVLPV